MVCEKTFKEFLQACRDERSPQKMAIFASNVSEKQEGHDGPEIAHLSLLTKHAPSSFPVT